MVYVQFKTDDSWTYLGFNASYTTNYGKYGNIVHDFGKVLTKDHWSLATQVDLIQRRHMFDGGWHRLIEFYMTIGMYTSSF